MIGPIRTGGGVRGKFLEALACGCPVVTTPLGASGIGLTEEDGLLTRETSPQMAEVALQLLSDRDRRAGVSTRGVEAIRRRHSHAVHEAGMGSLLDEMLG